MYIILRYNYMFRPSMLAIFRLYSFVSGKSGKGRGLGLFSVTVTSMPIYSYV